MSLIDPTKYEMKGNAQTTAQTSSTSSDYRPNLTDDELCLMAREKLSELLQGMDARTAPALLLSVAREVMDRIEGKPGQAITFDANLRVVNVNANIEFIQPARDKVIDGPVGNTKVIDNQ